MLKIPENLEENYLGEGSYGVVIKCFSEIKKNTKICRNFSSTSFVENALKINLKYKNEKVVGISSFKELSLLLTVNSYSKDNQETFVINIVDFIENSSIEKDIEPVLKHVTDGKKKDFDKIHFLFDYYEYDLESFIKTVSSKLTEKLIVNIFEDILLGLYWCYLNDVIHRDLKLTNILVKTEKGCYKSLKICDFGLGTYMKQTKDYKTHSPNVTSYYYRAPEVFNNLSYTFKIDYWALGIILLNLVSGELKIEIKDLSQIKKKVQKKFDSTFLETYFATIENDLLGEERKGIKILLKNPLLNKERINFYKKKFKGELKIRTEKNKEKMEEFIEQKKIIYTINNRLLERRVEFIDFLLELINDKPVWYKDEILYHSLYTFDRLVVYQLNRSCKHDSLRDRERDRESKPKQEDFFEKKSLFISILYIFYKFFSTLILIDFDSFLKGFPNLKKKFKKTEIEEIKEIEKVIFEEVYEYQLYEKTEYEVKGGHTDLKKYLLNEKREG